MLIDLFDFKSVEIVIFYDLIIYRLILMLKKFLNMIELCNELFEVQTRMTIGCLNWDLSESCFEILNVYRYIC